MVYNGSFQRMQGCFLALCCLTVIVDDRCSTAVVDDGGAVAFSGSFQRVQGCFLALRCSTAIVDDNCSTAVVDDISELLLLGNLIGACGQPMFGSALFDIGIFFVS